MKVKITVTTDLEVLLPSLPNFVRTDNKDTCIPIADLTDKQIRELGNSWTDALLVKAKKKRHERMREINKQLGNLSDT